MTSWKKNRKPDTHVKKKQSRTTCLDLLRTLLCCSVFLCAKRQLAGHPNIVQMLGFCDEAIVTDYYETVNEVLFREGRELPIAEVASLALDSARGLEVSLDVYGGR